MSATRQPEPSRRRWGRQAEAERNDHLVLEAARTVFAEQGAGAPMAALAEEAGVGIATFYRRYGSKEELLQRLCLLSMRESIAAAREALAGDGDGWSAIAHYVRRCVAARVGALAPAAGTIAVTDEMTAAAELGRELIEELAARGRADGSVRGDLAPLDVSYLVEHLSRIPRRAPEQAGVCDRLLAIALDGLRAPARVSDLPGTPPTWENYGARWYERAE
ncbi:TetR family transcriptional regulator [Sphaerisporangium siamense]|uniref:AcrR family transcriptional regulator n=1 Tax=Sphaerisporangium siamense TaxID=795645 RepID=A0A7W7D2Z0_9ACTN|nr:TetR/AcrR family transcriptional regulator [Sphaerisporangium siamense]MBB4699237.1 AcrR family transcriptional regulator [Sphaerisporangium siamense]GII86636.1 TetR family transcriptional regulator [Sphaerisporangium siamense]